MAPSGKSLEDQVREIQKLIADARETLTQAEWALETLAGRLDGGGEPVGDDA